jgi:hypothetical protein
LTNFGRAFPGFIVEIKAHRRGLEKTKKPGRTAAGRNQAAVNIKLDRTKFIGMTVRGLNEKSNRLTAESSASDDVAKIPAL